MSVTMNIDTKTNEVYEQPNGPLNIIINSQSQSPTYNNWLDSDHKLIES